MEWTVRLICCNYEMGSETKPTWEEADKLRNIYSEPVPGSRHVRTALVEKMEG